MTAPINFPTIQAPQLAPPKRSALDGFAELLASIQDRRAGREQEQQRINLERQRTETDTETSKFNRTNKQKELDLADLKVRADAIGERYARQFSTDPNATPALLSETIGTMIQNEDPKLTPYLVDAFGAHVKANQETLTSVAQRQTTVSDAKVAVDTEAERIATAKTASERATVELQRAGVELETSKIQQHLADVEKTYGAARGSIAGAVLQGGGTLGQAYRIIGVPVPAGVDPNWAVPKTAGAGGETQRKLEGTAGLVTLGSTMIDAAGDPEITKLGAFIRRGGTIGGLMEVLASSKLSDPERQAVAGYRMVGEGFALYVTGQQASATQVDRLVGVISKQPKEVGKAAETRAIIRHGIVDLIQTAAAGGSASAGMQTIIANAKARGADKKTISTLEVFAAQAKANEATKIRGKTPGDSTDVSLDALDPVVANRLNRPPQ